MSEDPQNSFEKHDSITITLGQALSLAGTLLALKILHAVALVFCTGPENAVQRAIQRTEQRAITILVSVVPDALYQAALKGRAASTEALFTLTDSNCQSLGRTNTGETQTTEKASSHANSPLLQVSSSISPAIRMFQCLSDRGMDLFSTNSGSGVDSLIPAAGSESVYSARTMRRSTSASKVYSRSSSIKQAMMVSAAQYAKIASERPRFSTASRPASMESMDQRHLSPMLESSQLGHSLLEMETLEATRSVESFPGKFPMSDGPAPHHMGGRGTTSVRPFSDCN
ncbi:uncharacterized protein ACLA_052280 [Aspergillus clavatus NRRL 1]|uniref:Uncharacterized protein n=1 Tax=Aspergillus clavatus (strain ATCC 1007 / CBS 513.65 / DSM 816 / NCTC 3887 / NRRL 1 / QM 1276 / 107) TaxID=344612 RepID=A1CIQ0_ASPCL|nr:uncharacterized protein ACLA_052280 [Aspergillus clavatus NRRL 1]EAW10755.1 conserved hypothetical protein [Aspergillus clavatus NRRL 1]